MEKIFLHKHIPMSFLSFNDTNDVICRKMGGVFSHLKRI